MQDLEMHAINRPKINLKNRDKSPKEPQVTPDRLASVSI